MGSVSPRKLNLSAQGNAINMALVLVGAVTFAFGLVKDPARIWPAYLTAYFYFVSLALGGLFFTALQHATKAGWSTSIRRITEAFTAFLPVAFVGGLILLAGGTHLYEWLRPDVVAADLILQKKAPYLNKTFFVIRLVVFFAVWMFFTQKIVGNSVKQDENGDESLTNNSLKWSVLFIMFFALSYSFFSVDLMMSLHAHWFSTMFGVYCFSGLFQSTLAFLAIMTVFLVKKGVLNDVVNENHIHDIGKFLFAFTVFYAYIGFSQFMLIWYANLPEETIFFVHRGHGMWMTISLSLLIFKFVVPFIALLPRGAKRNPNHLVAVSVLILIMQYVDNYWLVYPNFFEGHVVFSFWEVGVFLGFLGLFMATVRRFLSKNSALAHRDPRLHEALHHHT